MGAAEPVSKLRGLKHNYPATRKSRSTFRPERALRQAKRGLTHNEIAKAQGVNQSTVSRFMQRMAPEQAGVDQFKAHRADVLARLQAKSLKVTETIIDELEGGDIAALPTREKASLLIALNAQHGTTFDKERLERGQSTSNQSIVSKLIDSELRGLYRNPAPMAQVALPSDERFQSDGAELRQSGRGISEKGAAGGQAVTREGTRPRAPRTINKKPRVN